MPAISHAQSYGRDSLIIDGSRYVNTTHWQEVAVGGEGGAPPCVNEGLSGVPKGTLFQKAERQLLVAVL